MNPVIAQNRSFSVNRWVVLMILLFLLPVAGIAQSRMKRAKIQLQNSQKALSKARLSHSKLDRKSRQLRDSIDYLTDRVPALWAEARILDSLNELLTDSIRSLLGKNPWNKETWAEMNTGSSAGFMTAEEKEVLVALNLARSNPETFAELFIPTFLGRDFWRGWGWRYCSSSANKRLGMLDMVTIFDQTCYLTLKQIEPRQKLSPDSTMHALATCHAIASGEEGTMGHYRKTCPYGYGAECCHYGTEDSFGIVVDLLVDACVKSYGHREILLDGRFCLIRNAIRPHIKSGRNVVLDLN